MRRCRRRSAVSGDTAGHEARSMPPAAGGDYRADFYMPLRADAAMIAATRCRVMGYAASCVVSTITFLHRSRAPAARYAIDLKLEAGAALCLAA